MVLVERSIQRPIVTCELYGRPLASNDVRPRKVYSSLEDTLSITQHPMMMEVLSRSLAVNGTRSEVCEERERKQHLDAKEVLAHFKIDWRSR